MASDVHVRPQAGKHRAASLLPFAVLGFACGCSLAQAAPEMPGVPGVGAPPAASTGVRHAITWPRLQTLAGRRLREKPVSRLLSPTLQRVLSARFVAFAAALIDDQPLRIVGASLVGEGIVPDTLGYRGAFFVFGSQGHVLAVIKSGRHGTTIERFGALEVLNEPALLHAYQEFIGIDE